MRSLLVVVAACCVSAVFAASGTFDYRASTEWPGTCKTGEMQSPINIDTSTVKPAPEEAGRINVKTMGTVSDYTVFFTGVSLEIAFNKFSTPTETYIPANAYTIGDSEKVKAGDLLAVEPLQLHLHTMSEHTINGFYAPSEVHIVTRVKDGESDYCDRTGGCLAVFGVMNTFAKEGANAHAPFDGVFSEIPTKPGVDEGISYKGKLNLDDMLPSALDYYTYLGSLTTPPCSEIVTWHVFAEPVAISNDYVIAHQRMVSFTAGDDCTYTYLDICAPPREKTNHRPIQPYYGRDVYYVEQ